MIKNICVIGLGYIGLPTATMFSLYGHKVVGVDTNKEVIEKLNDGKIMIEEYNLEQLTNYAVKEGKLVGSAIPREADVFIIAVPTPIEEDKSADMKYVISATKSILKYLKVGNVVVLESTSPVGTTEEVIKPIIEESGFKVGSEIFLGYSPERVIPGNIVYELKNNDRVIGGVNEKSAKEIEKIYKTIVNGNIYLTDCKTAEICKLMENTYRDVNIALANELMLICDKLGINAWEVIEYSNKHPRVNLHMPGPGVGGHCLAVDPWFIVEKEPHVSKIIKSSRQLNDFMPTYVYESVDKLLNDKKDKNVTILGITYKANIDDIRESPIIKLIDLLLESNYTVKVFDPFVKDFYLNENNIISACKESDLLILGVNHDCFKILPLDEIKKEMRGNLMLDTRNYLNKEEIERKGFVYRLLGCKYNEKTTS
ncbi:nucleotide sugar dehydrogenase [Terrisporobacter vanillatitrophus]|uniref:nucleotide sugar dehydrogenase n=1 Tax=Terrisporobacter vanillatitrophus TaxID=3058402 RepID=UPI00336801A7